MITIITQLKDKLNVNCTRCPKKNATKIVCIISSATDMLDGWGISHLKNGICSFVWSTFLYDIKEQRYKEIKIGYHI